MHVFSVNGCINCALFNALKGMSTATKILQSEENINKQKLMKQVLPDMKRIIVANMNVSTAVYMTTYVSRGSAATYLRGGGN